MAAYTIDVNGMECQGCERVVRSRLTHLSGITDAVPDAESGEVCVYGEASTEERARRAIVDAGYELSE